MKDKYEIVKPDEDDEIFGDDCGICGRKISLTEKFVNFLHSEGYHSIAVCKDCIKKIDSLLNY